MLEGPRIICGPVASGDAKVLFVYGSLKRGGRHHAELRRADYLGNAVTVPGYALEEVGEYLALVARPQALESVSGEVYLVDQALLGALDEFEGPDYRRGAIELAEFSRGMTEGGGDGGGDSRESAAIRLALAYLRRTR